MADIETTWAVIRRTEELNEAFNQIASPTNDSGIAKSKPLFSAIQTEVDHKRRFENAMIALAENDTPTAAPTPPEPAKQPDTKSGEPTEPASSDDKEFARDIDQWLYDFWLENAQPQTSVFFRALKKQIGKQGSPIMQHWGAGSSDGGFHWKAGSLEDDMKYKTLGNKVTNFKNRVKPSK